MKRAKPGDGRPEWLEKLPDARDEEILSAAFDAFCAQGFHGATMSEIAAAAGASKKTLYARYRDKADLFRALLAWGCRNNLPESLPAEAADPRVALAEHARQIVTAMMREESLALFRIVAGEANRFPELARLFDTMTRKASTRIVESLAARLHEAGVCHVPDAAQFSADFIGLLRGELFYRSVLGVVRMPSSAALARFATAQVDRLIAAYAPA